MEWDDEYFRRESISVDFSISDSGPEILKLAMTQALVPLGVDPNAVLLAQLPTACDTPITRVTVRLPAAAKNREEITTLLKSASSVASGSLDAANLPEPLFSTLVELKTAPASSCKLHAVVAHANGAHGRELRAVGDDLAGVHVVERKHTMPRISHPLLAAFRRVKPYAPGKFHQDATVRDAQGGEAHVRFHVVHHEKTIALDDMPEVVHVRKGEENDEIQILTLHPMENVVPGVLLQAGAEWESGAFTLMVEEVEVSMSDIGVFEYVILGSIVPAHFAASLFEVDVKISPNHTATSSKLGRSLSPKCTDHKVAHSVEELSAIAAYDCEQLGFAKFGFNYDVDEGEVVEDKVYLVEPSLYLDKSYAYFDSSLELQLYGGGNFPDGFTLHRFKFELNGEFVAKVTTVADFPEDGHNNPLVKVTPDVSLDTIVLDVGFPVIIDSSVALYASLNVENGVELYASTGAKATATATFGANYNHARLDPNDDTCECVSECSCDILDCPKWCYVNHECKSGKPADEAAYSKWHYCENWHRKDATWKFVHDTDFSFEYFPATLSSTSSDGSHHSSDEIPSFTLDIDIAAGITFSIYDIIPFTILPGTTVSVEYDAPATTLQRSLRSHQCPVSEESTVDLYGGGTFVQAELGDIVLDMSQITGLHDDILGAKFKFANGENFGTDTLSDGELVAETPLCNAYPQGDDDDVATDDDTVFGQDDDDSSNHNGGNNSGVLGGVLGGIGGVLVVSLAVGLWMHLRRAPASTPSMAGFPHSPEGTTVVNPTAEIDVVVEGGSV